MKEDEAVAHCASLSLACRNSVSQGNAREVKVAVQNFAMKTPFSRFDVLASTSKHLF